MVSTPPVKVVSDPLERVAVTVKDFAPGVVAFDTMEQDAGVGATPTEVVSDPLDRVDIAEATKRVADSGTVKLVYN